jgi:hypothetical protein
MLKLCFQTIRILSKLPQSPGNGISENLNLKISSGLRPSFQAPNKKELPTALQPYSVTACFCNMSLPKLCVFLFVNCIFIFRLANTFVASYAMKYSEMLFVIRKFFPIPPTIHASYGPGWCNMIL